MTALSVMLVIVSYWTVSTSLIFMNKKLVSLTSTEQDLSVFIIWFQCACGVLFLILASTFSNKLHCNLGELKNLHLDLRQLLQQDMLLSSLAFVAALVFNSILLKYISVSFYQIARSLTIIFVIAISATVLQERVVPKILFAAMLIVSGFYLGVHEELCNYGVQFQGVLYGIVTSFFSACSSTLCKTCQKNKDISTLQFTYNVFTIGLIILTPFVLLGYQTQGMLQLSASKDTVFWCLMLLSGLCCLLVGWISTFQITLTSPLTYIISTNSKSVLQTLLAVLWNKEMKSWQWWLGNVFVITGIFLYTWFKITTKKISDVEVLVEDSKFQLKNKVE